MKCGLELPDDSHFCRKCGYAFPITEPQPLATAPSAPPPRPAQPSVNFGTLVFAGFSALSLLVSFAKGIVPIYLGEAILWAALAWFWHKKQPTSQAANVAVFLLAVAVAGGQGYLISRKPTQIQAGIVWQPARPKWEHLGPRKLILMCGTPISDREFKFKKSGLVGRELSVKGTDGTIVRITFFKLNDNGDERDDTTWGFLDATSDEKNRISSDSELEALFSLLPCLPQ